MPSTKPSKRWTNWCCAACGLLWLPGCFAPRAQLNVSRVSLPAYSQNPTRTMPQARGPARRQTAASPVTRSTPPGEAVPNFGSRSGSELERGVSRFTAHPKELLNPPTPTKEWRYIIVHHSGESNGGLASIDRYHREHNGWDECGYHFVIGNGSESGDGEIEVGSRWGKQKHGAHTKPEGNQEYNEHGIGICLVGNFNAEHPTPKQIEACRRLVAFLQQRCNVPAKGITTHGDVMGTHTDCPGKYFPYDRLIPNSGFASR